jgi:FkbM family methyltransferase
MDFLIKVYKYTMWKFGIDKLIQKLTKNYWNQGKNYEWLSEYIFNERLDTSAIIEIGSRDALDSISLLKKYNFKQAFVFEPSNPGILMCLQNIKNSKYSERINFYPFAIGENFELKTFYENTEKIDVPNIGASSFFSQNLNEYKAYKVPVVKLSDVLSEVNLDFYLAMIDVEGFELEVISNQKELFSRFKYICLEVTHSTILNQNNHNLIKINNTLNEYGFNLVASKYNPDETIENLLDLNISHSDLLYKRHT